MGSRLYPENLTKGLTRSRHSLLSTRGEQSTPSQNTADASYQYGDAPLIVDSTYNDNDEQLQMKSTMKTINKINHKNNEIKSITKNTEIKSSVKNIAPYGSQNKTKWVGIVHADNTKNLNQYNYSNKTNTK